MKKIFISLSLLVCFAISSPLYATWTTQWQLGADGRAWPLDGTGGGPDVDFVQESNASNPLPGDPNSPATHGQADDDYYFAGVYPAPIGVVLNDEIAMERAFTGSDGTLRIHFNLPNPSLAINDSTQLRFTLGPANLNGTTQGITHYGVEMRFNGNLIQPEIDITPADLASTFTTPAIPLGAVGAQYGLGGDNVLELTGINYNATGGGNWMGMDYHLLELNQIPEPSTTGLILCGVIVASLSIRRRKA